MASRSQTFSYGALIASLVMGLAALTCLVDVFQTNRSITQLMHGALIDSPATEVAKTLASCPDEMPILVGYSDTGLPLCRRLVTKACPTGFYLSSIDPVTLKTECRPAGAVAECAANQFISKFVWKGAERIEISCSPRVDPFIAFKFEPRLEARTSP